jgi:hypothetical protein
MKDTSQELMRRGGVCGDTNTTANPARYENAKPVFHRI